MPRNKKNTVPKKSQTAASSQEEELQVIEDEEGEDVELSEKKLSYKPSGMAHDELKELIEKNIKWSQVIYNQNKKIKRRLTMMVIGNYVRLALILAPIILGIIFLPPFIEQYMSQFGDLFGAEGSTSTLYDIGTLLQRSNIDASQVKELINTVN